MERRDPAILRPEAVVAVLDVVDDGGGGGGCGVLTWTSGEEDSDNSGVVGILRIKDNRSTTRNNPRKFVGTQTNERRKHKSAYVRFIRIRPRTLYELRQIPRGPQECKTTDQHQQDYLYKLTVPPAW